MPTVKLPNEHGQIDIDQLSKLSLEDHHKIDLNLHRNLSSMEWQLLANSFPFLDEIHCYDSKGDRLNLLKEKRYSQIFEGLMQTQCFAKRLDESPRLQTIFDNYRAAILEVLAVDDSQQTLNNIAEHLNLVNTFIINPSPNRYCSLEKFLNQSEGLFDSKEQLNLYNQFKSVSVALIAIGCVGLFASLIVCPNPVVMVMFGQSLYQLPLLACGIASIGMMGYIISDNYYNHALQNSNAYHEVQKMGLSFFARPTSNAQIVLPQVPTAPPTYEKIDNQAHLPVAVPVSVQ